MEIINSLGIASVAGITIIVYLLGMIVGASGIDNKWIPAICGLAGAVLGVAGLFFMPDYPATDVINAVAVGIASGLAATGVDQMVKQLGGKTNADNASDVAALKNELQALRAKVAEYEMKQETAAEAFVNAAEEVE